VSPAHTNGDGCGQLGEAPLSGVRVVECASYVSGPMAAQVLADLGAEVIKVEPPRGDPLRTFGLRHRGLSAMWVNINRGKKSVVIDLKADGGANRLRELLITAHVFIQNWRPGVADSLGLGDEALAALNPGLVRVAITGFGTTGPSAAKPVFDILLQAASGLAASEGSDARPTAMRSIIADKTTAVFAANAVLAALVRRATTGRGSRIDLAMLDVLAYFDFPDLGQDRTFLDVDAPNELARGRSGLLETSDGFIAVSPVSGQQIGAAVTAVGHPEWKAELKRVGDPTELTNVLYDLLESETRTRPTAHWVDVFHRNDVPAAAVLTIDEHLADEQVRNNELYWSSPSPAGEVRQVRFPLRLDGLLLDRPGVAPGLGEHSDEVLAAAVAGVDG
jgi:crotonobetainyl-CoA:carnitine CoA-transferase CaiB-like acyl-CoA transferase